MATNLDSALKQLGLSDAEFGAACKPPIHRSQVWNYRHRRRTPLSTTANVILAALKSRGVEMKLSELAAVPRISRAA